MISERFAIATAWQQRLTVSLFGSAQHSEKLEISRFRTAPADRLNVLNDYNSTGGKPWALTSITRCLPNGSLALGCWIGWLSNTVSPNKYAVTTGLNGPP